MPNQFSHLAIAVENINKAKKFFELLTGNSISKIKPIESQKVNTAFIKIGKIDLELLEPSNDNSPISNFLSKRGGGIHHICIQTEEFDNLVEKITKDGIRKLSPPFIGAKSKRVIFFHPKDTFNVLIEIEETKIIS